jgi:hypothetical protein
MTIDVHLIKIQIFHPHGQSLLKTYICQRLLVGTLFLAIPYPSEDAQNRIAPVTSINPQLGGHAIYR